MHRSWQKCSPGLQWELLWSLSRAASYCFAWKNLHMELLLAAITPVAPHRRGHVSISLAKRSPLGKASRWLVKTLHCSFSARAESQCVPEVFLTYWGAPAEFVPRAHVRRDGADHLQDVLPAGLCAADALGHRRALPLLPALQGARVRARRRRLVQGAPSLLSPQKWCCVIKPWRPPAPLRSPVMS